MTALPCCGSRKNVFDDVPVHIGQPEVPSLILVCQSLVINPQLIQDRCLQVMHMNTLIGHVVTEWICFAVAHPTLNPAAGHPY